MRTARILFLFAAPLTLLLGSVRAYERLQGPTELLYWNKEKAFNGYTLFGLGSRSYLLDMQGRVVHTWPLGTNPQLLENGHLLASLTGFVEDRGTYWLEFIRPKVI